MSDNPDEWSDDFFLSYVTLHADTPRALFSKDHVVRLLKLAGRGALASDVERGSRKFYSLPSDEAGPLVKAARARIEHAARIAADKVDAKRMVARQYHVAAERALQCSDLG